MRFDGKVAIVTGAAGKIGSTIAKRLASEGAIVAITDINATLLEAVADEINKNGGKAKAYPLDIKDSSAVNAHVEQVIKEFGKVDLLVSSSGGSARAKMTTLVNQTDEIIHNIFGINFFGALYYCRACGRNMIENKYGKIVCISSISGVCGGYKQTEYAASKGATVSMVKALSKELGEYGINVNCVAPGIVPRDDDKNDYSKFNYLGRTCTAEEISNVVCFLLSDEASFVTGQDYIVDGGRSLAMRGSAK